MIYELDLIDDRFGENLVFRLAQIMDTKRTSSVWTFSFAIRVAS